MKFKNTFKYISIVLILVLAGLCQPSVSVSAFGETAVINPTSGPQSTVITITGTGWGNGTLVNIGASPHWGGTAVSVTANSSGAFTTTFTVPLTAEPGAYIIYISSAYSVVSTQFTVVSGFNLTPGTGPAGSVVNVSGSGFTSGQNVPLLWDNSVLLVTAMANSAGAISANVTIPAGVRGGHTISTTVGGMNTSTFMLGSKITLSPVSGGGGVVVGVTGSGFAAGTQVSIGGITGLTPFNAGTSATGSFSAVFTVPSNAPRGAYTLSATDAGGGATAVFNVTQSIILTLPAGKTKAAPGNTISISGQNLAPGPVTFKLDGTALPGLTGTASSTGVMADVNFIVPGIPAGLHNLTAVGSDMAEASAQFTVGPGVTLSTANCQPGSAVIFSGAGFAANSAVTITLGAGPTLAMTTTDANGSFGNTTVTIPAGASGDFLLTARDAFANSAGAVLTVQINWTPNLSPVSGAPNVPVNPTVFDWDDLTGASGYEFQIAAGNSIPAGTTTVSLTQSTHSVSGLANNVLYAWRVRALSGTLAGEWVSAYFSTVAAAPATQTITVTPTPVTITVTQPPQVITVPPVTVTMLPPASAIISENTSQSQPGHVGMDINIAGTGFKPHSTITITFESTPITVATATSDASGSFLAAFKVPAVPAGIHTIRATDGTTTKEFLFMMDASAPAAVTLFAPVTRQPVEFSWNPCIDPSGVTYALQISRDASFSTVILEKTGLTTAAYRVADAEKLEGDVPFYWRVRAVDLAGNVGEWSNGSSFNLGFVWLDWMIYAGIGLGALVVLILGLLLGRRMSMRYY